MLRVLSDEEAAEGKGRLADFAAHRGFTLEFAPFLAQSDWRSMILRKDGSTVWTGNSQNECEWFINGWVAHESLTPPKPAPKFVLGKSDDASAKDG